MTGARAGAAPDAYSRWSRRARRAAFHLVVLFVIGEVISRRYIAGPMDMLQRSDDPVLMFELKPGKFHANGYFVRLADVDYEIDADGCRRWGRTAGGRERMAMLLTGSSRTFGMGVELEKTFGYVAWKTVQARSKEPLPSSNCSVPGYNLTQNLHRAAMDVARVHPRLVVFGVNSSHLRTPVDWTRLSPRNNVVHAITRHVRLARLAYLLQLAHGDAFHESELPPSDIERGLDELQAALAKTDTRALFLLLGEVRSSDYDLGAMLQRRGFAVRQIAIPEKGSSYYLADDDHWNPEGHALIGDEVAKVLAESLSDDGRSSTRPVE